MDSLRRAFWRRLLASYKRRKQRASDTSLEHCLEVARGIGRHSKYCFLITRGQGGWSSARLVEPIVELDTPAIWVGTNPSLRKVTEVRADPRVTLAFENTRERANLVVYGEARLETDLATRRRYWRGEWRLFFPHGPAGDDYVLLRIEPLRMELMSFGGNVVPEPFGLRPVVLTREGRAWRLGEDAT